VVKGDCKYSSGIVTCRLAADLFLTVVDFGSFSMVSSDRIAASAMPLRSFAAQTSELNIGRTTLNAVVGVLQGLGGKGRGASEAVRTESSTSPDALIVRSVLKRVNCLCVDARIRGCLVATSWDQASACACLNPLCQHCIHRIRCVASTDHRRVCAPSHA